MIECPECENSIEVDEVENLEDCGDCVIGTTAMCCPQCGAMFTVRLTFNWDGAYEID